MNKSYEDLREEHRIVVTELGRLQQKALALSTSINTRGMHLTYVKAKEWMRKPIWYKDGVWYIDHVKNTGEYIRTTGWVIEKNSVRRFSYAIAMPDHLFLSGVVLEDEDGYLQGTLDRIASIAKEDVNYYEKKAQKKLKTKAGEEKK